jgi:5,10-methylenetetrahydrofolate reductase
MQLLETGLFDKYHFKRFHVAGHPEGNKDIDAGASGDPLGDALRWKQAFSDQTSAEMAIVTQFSFSAAAVYEWAAALKLAGISLPIHIGIAGPTKLQTLIKFAISCGVGPSLKVLQKRAKDISKLLLPYEPSRDRKRSRIDAEKMTTKRISQRCTFSPWVVFRNRQIGCPLSSSRREGYIVLGRAFFSLITF